MFKVGEQIIITETLDALFRNRIAKIERRVCKTPGSMSIYFLRFSAPGYGQDGIWFHEHQMRHLTLKEHIARVNNEI